MAKPKLSCNEVGSILQEQWNELSLEERKVYISYLLGNHCSFSQIASIIGTTVGDIKEARDWKPENKSMEYFTEHLEEQEAKEKVNPKILKVAPAKAVYTQTFDEILAKYREWIGMTTTISPAEVVPTDYLEGIIISDIHAPFHDEERFARMIKENKGNIDICILAGDGPDFFNYSKYLKYGHPFSMLDEHKAFMAILAILSESFPLTIFMQGNHDERSRKKYAGVLSAELYQSLLEFHGSNAFDFAELMAEQFENIVIPQVPKNGWAEYRFLYQINDIVVMHAELFSKISCKSVSSAIEWLHKKALPMGLVKPFKYVVQGHTHMAGKIWYDYDTVGIENGCLCITPDYDGNAKLGGVPRPTTKGYTRFRTNKATGKTASNDIQFIELE